MSQIIEQITIVNFKSIVNHTFELSPYTPLVGYNNAGKTNILEAIKWGIKKSVLDASYFYNPSNPIEVALKINGITEEVLRNLGTIHRPRIEPFIDNEVIELKRVYQIPGDRATNIKTLVKNPTQTDPENAWQINPTGIDSAISILFPDPIHITGMDNSSEDVSKIKTSNTIGKLLNEIISTIEEQYGEQVRTALGSLKDVLDADGKKRASELNEFDREVNEKIDSFFPDINIKVHVPTPEIKEVFNRGTIKIYENGGSEGRDFSSLGLGAQRAIQMALIRHLADTKTNPSSAENTSTTLLLIDEPELYLHPQAIEILRLSLKILSEQGYQIIITTHSPFMITEKDVANTVLIRKNASQGTYKRNTLLSAVSSLQLSAPHQLSLLFTISNSANILFSEKVILAEGKTERRLLPQIFEKIAQKTLGYNKFALVDVGGSTNTKKAMEVLKGMDLPVKAIVDLDFVMKQGIKDGYILDTDPDLLACQNHLLSIASNNNIKLGDDNWPTGKDSQVSASRAYTILASEPQIKINIENLKQKFLSHNIWIWKKGTIENHLNLLGKTESIWATFSQNLNDTTLDILLPNDYQEVTDCINWLRA